MKALTVKYWSNLFQNTWKKLLKHNKPKKPDKNTNNFYLNLFFIGVVIFHISGSLITRLEAGGDLGPRYTGMLTVNLVGIYLGSMGLMKLYWRVKKTVETIPKWKKQKSERVLIKSIRKARVHKLKR